MDYFHGAISVQTAKRILLSSSKGEKIGRYLLREVEDSHIISYVDAKEKVDHILLPKQYNSKLLQFNPHLVSVRVHRLLREYIAINKQKIIPS